MGKCIKALLFDLDGVLIDAAWWHKEAFDRTLVEFCCEPLEVKDHLVNFNGLSTYRKLDIIDGRFSFGIQRDNFYRIKQRHTVEIIEEKCVPVTRVIDVVNYANSIFNSQTAVVTNCSRATTELMLKKSNLLDRFQFIISNEDVDGFIKPHPRPYVTAMHRMNLGAKEALAIDDTGRGIQSAVDARCRTWRLKRFADLSVRNLMNVLHNYRYCL